MDRFLRSALALLRGAMLAWLLAGLADALGTALGGGADVRALALGGLLLALATGLMHQGAGHPPFQASFLWLALGAALPMFSGLAPLAAIGGLLFLLPLRALGARLSGMLALENGPAHSAAMHLFGAALGLAWAAGHGLGLSGFLIGFAASGVLTSKLPAPAVEHGEEELTPRQRGAARLARFAAGAGLTWTLLLLAPMARAFDASGAGQDAVAVLCCLLLVFTGWWTLGAVAAQSRDRSAWTALAAAATGLLLPFMVRWIQEISQPLNFEARMRTGITRWLADAGAPRLPEEHALYLPWVLLGTIALPAILCGITLRGAIGKKPSGPDEFAPLIAGVGAALIAFSLPIGAAGTVPWLGLAALAALLAAAAADLLGATGRRWPRVTAGVAITAAAALVARPFPAPVLEYPVQDSVDWQIAQDAMGWELSVAGRTNYWRIVEQTSGSPAQFLASGRNLLTPALDVEGLWVRDLDLALQCAQQTGKVLMAGAPHPASLRALARAGVKSVVLAHDPAITGLLRRRDPGGYGLEVTHSPSLARADGKFDLVLLRSLGMWQEEISLFSPWAATQARNRLRPGGACVLALDPAQLTPGLMPALVATWQRVFSAVDLLVEPDGLRGVRLLLVGRRDAGALPVALQPLAVPPEWLQRIADAGSVASLMAPLPRVHGKLSETAWRLVDELRSVRRAQAVLEELSNVAGDNPPPSLLAAAARQYAAQEYSAHDTFKLQPADALEVSEPALQELLRLARAWPESAWLRSTWADAGATLADKREVAMVETFMRPLREELGWRGPGITLSLARAALEMLDEEGAQALIAEALAAEPENAEALRLKRVLEGTESLAPDAHQGHEHD